MTTTPKLGLTLPVDGTVPWGSIVNENFTLIDAAISTISSRQSVTFTLSGTTGSIASPALNYWIYQF